MLLEDMKRHFKTTYTEQQKEKSWSELDEIVENYNKELIDKWNKEIDGLLTFVCWVHSR